MSESSQKVPRLTVAQRRDLREVFDRTNDGTDRAWVLAMPRTMAVLVRLGLVERKWYPSSGKSRYESGLRTAEGDRVAELLGGDLEPS